MTIRHPQYNSGAGRVVNTSNVAVGTTHRYEDWNNQGFLFGFIHITMTNVRVTIHATSDAASVANVDAVWVDITNSLFGVYNFTSASELNIDTPCAFDRLRITMEALNATNSCVVRVNKSR